jgi:hypothetical protein
VAAGEARYLTYAVAREPVPEGLRNLGAAFESAAGRVRAEHAALRGRVSAFYATVTSEAGFEFGAWVFEACSFCGVAPVPNGDVLLCDQAAFSGGYCVLEYVRTLAPDKRDVGGYRDAFCQGVLDELKCRKP